jgi:HSP20 family protein
MTNFLNLVLLAMISSASAYTHDPVVMTYRQCRPSSSFIERQSSIPLKIMRSLDRDPILSASQIFNNLASSFDLWENIGGIETHHMPIDVKETDKRYEVVVDVPGVDKDSVKIEIKDHVLSISTERKSQDKSETEKFRRVERFVGTVSRSLRLPDDVDENQVEATFKDGVLSIKIPKKPEDESKKVKQIQINYE